MSANPSESDLKKLKVAELKEKLQELNLPVTGKKEELIGRLLGHFTKTGSGSEVTADTTEDKQVKTGREAAEEDPTINPTPVVDSAAEAAKDNEKTDAPRPVYGVAKALPTQNLSEEEKRKIRAARFGIPYHATPQPEAKEKLEQRAARFHNDSKDKRPREQSKETTAINEEEQAKRLKRAERFGAVTQK